MLHVTRLDVTGDRALTRREMSRRRLEKPHSLSNQPRTVTPRSAVVWVPDGSNRQDAGLFFTSIETVGSGAYARTPRNGPAAASAIALLTCSMLTERSSWPESCASDPTGVGT